LPAADPLVPDTADAGEVWGAEVEEVTAEDGAADDDCAEADDWEGLPRAEDARDPGGAVDPASVLTDDAAADPCEALLAPGAWALAVTGVAGA
jgi:hypothetical protein